MHRDLKPENLLFRNKDTFDCVIADYGLAEFSQAEEYLFVRCGTPDMSLQKSLILRI